MMVSMVWMKKIRPFCQRRLQSIIEVAKTSKTDMVGITNHDVIENFDFEKLTRSNEITGDFDVGLRWSRLPARMIMRDDDCGGTRHDG